MSDASMGTSKIEDRAQAVIARERMADIAWGLGAIALPAGLVVAAAALIVARLLCLPVSLTWAALLPVIGVVVWASIRPRSLRAAARRLDKHYGLHDQLGHALEMADERARLGSTDPRARAFAAITLERALAKVDEVDPRAVVPMPRPAPRLLDGLALALFGVSFLVPEFCDAPANDEALAPGMSIDPSAGSEEPDGMDLALAEPLRQDLRALEAGKDAPAKIAVAIAEVLDGLERGDLDRAAAMERLEQLDQELIEAELAMEAAEEEDPWLLGEAMRDLAEAFEKHEITEDVADALERGNPEEAEAALDKALEEAEEAGGDTKDAMDQALSDAERSLANNAERNTDTSSELAEAERRLNREKKRKPDESEDPEERERRLKKQQDRVDQLRRQHEAEKKAREALDQLRRQAKQSRGKGGSQQQQQGRKQAQQKMSQQTGGAARKAGGARRMSSARDALEEAKSFVRRAGNQGEQGERRKKQQQSFTKAAKGQRGQGNKGKKGPSLLVEGEVGEGQPDAMLLDEGQGQDGQGQGQDGQGQDGQGQGQDGQGQDGQGQGQQAGSAGGPGLGDGMGDGSVDPLGEDETGMDARAKNVRVDADHGRGATRAEVIRDSSQQGFASQSYRRVYSDYRAFAQSAMDNESMPPGQRRRVKRYFQLIQPRTGGKDGAN